MILQRITHQLALGQSFTGKTTQIQQITAQLARQGITSLVYDRRAHPGRNSNGWAGIVLNDFSAYLQLVNSSRNCYCVMDDAGRIFGNKDYCQQASDLLTDGRHLGHCCCLIAQRLEQLEKTARDQASQLFLFNIDPDDAKRLSKNWNSPELNNAPYLKIGMFYNVQRMQKAKLQKIIL